MKKKEGKKRQDEPKAKEDDYASFYRALHSRPSEAVRERGHEALTDPKVIKALVRLLREAHQETDTEHALALHERMTLWALGNRNKVREAREEIRATFKALTTWPPMKRGHVLFTKANIVSAEALRKRRQRG